MFKGTFVLPELIREIRTEEQRVELEGQLARVHGRVEVTLLLGHDDGSLQRADPFVHRLHDRVANQARPAVEFERCRREEASAGEHAAADVLDPAVTDRQQARVAARLAQRRP
jgi:hypothetical protein